MQISLLKFTGFITFLFTLSCTDALAQNESPVRIEFDDNSKCPSCGWQGK